MSEVSSASSAFDAWADLMACWEPFSDSSDVDFYARVAAGAERPSVELGIGYGRVAARVRPDFGVDFSEVMIRRARGLVPETTLIRSDLASFALPRTVRFAYAPLNTFDGIVDDDQLCAALRTIHEHVEPGGLFVFDGAVPDLARSIAENRRVDLAVADERVAIMTSEEVVDRGTGELRVTAIVDELGEGGIVRSRRYFPPMPYRARTPREWEALLTETGWQIEARHGGIDGEPLEDDSHQQVWFARRV